MFTATDALESDKFMKQGSSDRCFEVTSKESYGVQIASWTIRPVEQFLPQSEHETSEV